VSGEPDDYDEFGMLGDNATQLIEDFISSNSLNR
jgi:hypothetical protein